MSFEITQTFLDDQHDVIPKNASAAIIVNKYDQVLLQLRMIKKVYSFPIIGDFLAERLKMARNFQRV